MVLIIIGVPEARGTEDKMTVSRWDMGSLKKKKKHGGKKILFGEEKKILYH